MKASKAVTFNLYTTKHFHSRNTTGGAGGAGGAGAGGAPLQAPPSDSNDPICKMKGVELGAFDYLLCKAGDGVLL